MRNRTYGGVRGRKTKVGGKLLRFPPTRFLGCVLLLGLGHLVDLNGLLRYGVDLGHEALEVLRLKVLVQRLLVFPGLQHHEGGAVGEAAVETVGDVALVFERAGGHLIENGDEAVAVLCGYLCGAVDPDDALTFGLGFGLDLLDDCAGQGARELFAGLGVLCHGVGVKGGLVFPGLEYQQAGGVGGALQQVKGDIALVLTGSLDVCEGHLDVLCAVLGSYAHQAIEAQGVLILFGCAANCAQCGGKRQYCLFHILLY
jgi:hypothetical protein